MSCGSLSQFSPKPVLTLAVHFPVRPVAASAEGNQVSAFILRRRDIDHLVGELTVRGIPTFPAGFEPGPGLKGEDVVGRMLWRENLTGVHHLHPRDVSGERRAPAGFVESDVETYTYTRREPLGRADVLELAALYDRNSRAPDTYWRSAPCRWVTALQEAVAAPGAVEAA